MTDTAATMFIVAVAVAAVTTLAGFLVNQGSRTDDVEHDQEVWDG